MNASSLMDLLRLAHGVLDFLVKQPADQVAAFARGQTGLAFVTPDGPPAPSLPEAAPKTVERANSGPKNSIMSDAEAAEIAQTLRGFDTETEGLSYLKKVARNQGSRRAVARALNIEGADSMKVDPLIALILRHAIGARRTFADLSSW